MRLQRSSGPGLKYRKRELSAPLADFWAGGRKLRRKRLKWALPKDVKAAPGVLTGLGYPLKFFIFKIQFRHHKPKNCSKGASKSGLFQVGHNGK